MSFGQSWTGPADGGFSADPTLQHLDFSTFDPSLIESLPDTIPDFFLEFPRETTTTTTTSANTLDTQASQLQQQAQALPDLLSPPQPPSFAADTHSCVSSPSESSPNNASEGRSGAGRATLPRRDKEREKEAAEDPDVVLKRQRNTIAARKYRQKRLDRIKELEDALEAMTQERDELRLKLARQEAETAALREMMQMKNEKGS